MSKSMKYFLNSFLFVVFVSEHIISFVESIKEDVQYVNQRSNSDTLVFAHVIHRHGDRNIVKQYPNDPYKGEEHWPEGYGQLTNKGKRQSYAMGKYFYRRYNKLLGNKYSPKDVYIQSTDVDRTLMSAQANLAGLFFPGDEEKWNQNILWQPIPVHTQPNTWDHILSGGRYCAKYNKLFKKYMKESPEVQRIYSEYKELLAYWSEMSGTNIKTTEDVYYLYSTLTIERDQNKTLSNWAKKAIEPNGPMEYITKFNFKVGTNTKQLARLKSGFLIKEMLNRFSEKIQSKLEPNRSLWIYSAHDFTISNVLNSLGLYELHILPYVCSLHFELYKTTGNQYYLQLFYRKPGEEFPIAMNIPGCGDKCPINEFHQLFDEIIPGNFNSECRHTESY